VSPERTAARRQAWLLAGGVLLLYALLRATAGPLAQWLDYHDFADTRVLGPIPHAGDVPSRHTAAALLLAAIALDGVETLSERLDWQIWRATGGIVSGHNLKHVLAGMVIACVSLWVLRRRALAPSGSAPAALPGRPVTPVATP